MKFIKMIKMGLYKLAILTHLKPTQLYVLLGLLIVVLVALALGTKVLGTKKEGFDSIRNVNRALPQIVDNMNGAINNGGWTIDANKRSFSANVNYWFQQQMLYLVEGGVDLKNYDTNKNNKLYQLNPELQGSLDASGNSVPMYVDDNITPTPRFLQQYTVIDIKDSITKEELNVLESQITNKINSFSTTDPTGQKRLQTAFDALKAFAINLGAYLVDNPDSSEVPSFSLILAQGTLTGSRGGGSGGGGRYAVSVRDVSYNSSGGWVNGEWTDISDNGSQWGGGGGYSYGYGGGGGGGYDSGFGYGGGGGYQSGYGNANQGGGGSYNNQRGYANQGGGGGYGGGPGYSNQGDDNGYDGEYGGGGGYSGQGGSDFNQPRGQSGSQTTLSRQSGSQVRQNGSQVRQNGSQVRQNGSQVRQNSVGVTKADIPPGSEDMYMLKTQVVPPTNPPGAKGRSGQKGSAGQTEGTDANSGPSPCKNQSNNCNPAPVPPCPPCERCPEPAFDCKRVPKYNSPAINPYLPQPVLADFSQFGM